MARHLVQRPFQSPQGLDLAGRRRAAATQLRRLQARGHLGLVGLQVGDGAVETRGRLGLVLDRGFEPGRQILEGLEHTPQVVAATSRRTILAGRPVDGLAPARAVESVVAVVILGDHVGQPLAEGHARAPREILGDLAGLRVDALYGPGRP